MSVKLTFQIKLKSDYHVSAGHGLGAVVDSALLREADGVPVLRGTTLAGLLRDGLWRLMQLDPMKKQGDHSCQASGSTEEKASTYCGQFNPAQALCPVCRLIGTPRRPRHWQISSARPVEVETVAAPKWTAGQTGAQVAQRARINPRSRRAEPHKLFSQEEGQASLVFTFTVSTRASGPGVLDEAALWVAAARMVRQLGRSRRRGQGECLFELVELVSDTDIDMPAHQETQIWLLDRFAQNWLQGTPAAPPEPEPFPVAVLSPDKTKGNAQRFRLLLRTDEPVIIAKRAEAGNQFETLPIITGQVIRGVLAWLVAGRFDLADQNSEGYRQFVQLFLRDGLSFPMLYPARLARSGNECYPAIPAPRNWLTCKTVGGLPAAGHGMFGGLGDAPARCQHPGCEAPLQPLGDFVTLNPHPNIWQDRNFLFVPAQRSELHVQLDPRSGRAAEGNLFSYTALEAGQYFVGEIKSAAEAYWSLFQELTGLTEQTPQTLRLGKASRRGYGKVTIWLEALPDETPLTWIAQPLAQRVTDPNHITLTLLTDTIVTDAWGRYMDGFTSNWLSKALGMTVAIIPHTASAQARVVDGFNAYTGLPRWRDWALAAGSAVRLKLIDPPADWPSRLAQLETDGIGLRRSEGFGQLAFNHPVYTHCQNIAPNLISLEPEMRLGTGNHPALKADLFKKSWLEELDTGRDWSKCKDAQFVAVARWLHGQADQPPARLAEQLAGLGTPDQALQAAIRSAEYGGRVKENKLLKDQQRGIKLIQDLLIELAERAEDRVHWPLGIQLMAERVADSVEKEGDDR